MADDWARPGASSTARDLPVPGRELGGIHLAMSYLRGDTWRLLDAGVDAEAPIDAAGKDVVVIGGGDSGTDCVGTAIRQGARSVRQLELLARPPDRRAGTPPRPAGSSAATSTWRAWRSPTWPGSRVPMAGS